MRRRGALGDAYTSPQAPGTARVQPPQEPSPHGVLGRLGWALRESGGPGRLGPSPRSSRGSPRAPYSLRRARCFIVKVPSFLCIFPEGEGAPGVGRAQSTEGLVGHATHLPTAQGRRRALERLQTEEGRDLPPRSLRSSAPHLGRARGLPQAHRLGDLCAHAR